MNQLCHPGVSAHNYIFYDLVTIVECVSERKKIFLANRICAICLNSRSYDKHEVPFFFFVSFVSILLRLHTHTRMHPACVFPIFFLIPSTILNFVWKCFWRLAVFVAAHLLSHSLAFFATVWCWLSAYFVSETIRNLWQNTVNEMCCNLASEQYLRESSACYFVWVIFRPVHFGELHVMKNTPSPFIE